MESRCNMAVGIKGYLYTGVSETFLYYLGVYALFEEQRGMTVSGVM